MQVNVIQVYARNSYDTQLVQHSTWALWTAIFQIIQKHNFFRYLQSIKLQNVLPKTQTTISLTKFEITQENIVSQAFVYCIQAFIDTLKSPHDVQTENIVVYPVYILSDIEGDIEGLEGITCLSGFLGNVTVLHQK